VSRTGLSHIHALLSEVARGYSATTATGETLDDVLRVSQELRKIEELLVNSKLKGIELAGKGNASTEQIIKALQELEQIAEKAISEGEPLGRTLLD